uniref:Uncharacterized protein n=1 Tax=Ditylenchus dipsaci TaxID=166011 RepID=A0A915EN73_9BILA
MFQADPAFISSMPALPSIKKNEKGGMKCRKKYVLCLRSTQFNSFAGVFVICQTFDSSQSALHSSNSPLGAL